MITVPAIALVNPAVAPATPMMKHPARRDRPHGGGQKSVRSRGRAVANMPYDIAERILDCLAAADGPLNLAQLCEKLKISDDQRRPFSSLLNELAAAHRVLQPRPGRFLAVGSGGEIPGVVIAGPGEQVLVRTSDEEEVPVDARSTLPIRAGDQLFLLAAKVGH